MGRVTDEPAEKRQRGVRRVSGPTGGQGAEAFAVSPFGRLARVQAFSAAGDALVAIALADSLFFDIDPNDARWRVALYLLITMAPFAIVAPFLGPAMDRLKGGHRFMMIGSAATRCLLGLVMAFNLQSLFLFPLAFAMLVMGKSHHIAKSAMVPGTVRDQEGLVRANARLSMISAISAGIAGVPGIILLKVGGSPSTLFLAGLIFIGGALLGTKIEPTQLAPDPAGQEEKAELRGSGIILAASAMGYVRGVVGFLTMLLAFELRGGIDPGPTAAGVDLGHKVRGALGLEPVELASGGAPAWHFAAVLLALGVGGLGGAVASPRLREHVKEERILAGALGAVGVFGTLAAIVGGLPGAMLIAFAVSVAGQMGKQSFDAIVQRDAPVANLGRSFSRFESRFQMVWVVGALIPVVVSLPARLGFIFVAAASAFAAVTYWLGKDPAPTQQVPKERVDAVRRRVSSRLRSHNSEGRKPRRRKKTSEPSPPRQAPNAQPEPPIQLNPTEEYVIPPGPPPTSPPPP